MGNWLFILTWQDSSQTWFTNLKSPNTNLVPGKRWSVEFMREMPSLSTTSSLDIDPQAASMGVE